VAKLARLRLDRNGAAVWVTRQKRREAFKAVIDLPRRVSIADRSSVLSIAEL